MKAQFNSQLKARQRKMAGKGMAKARTRDSRQEVAKLTRLVDGRPRIIADPPLIVPVTDLLPKDMDREAFAAQVQDLLGRYRRTLETDRRYLLEQYGYADMARKVVGVGSVGTRCWIVLMLGRDESDPLFLQVKEADESVLSRFVGASKYASMGQRGVAGQRLMQATSDIFLRDWKYSIAIEALIPHGMRIYGQACGAGAGPRARPLRGPDRHRRLPRRLRRLRPGHHPVRGRVRRPERTRPPSTRQRRRLRTAHRRTRHVRSG